MTYSLILVLFALAPPEKATTNALLPPAAGVGLVGTLTEKATTKHCPLAEPS